MRPRECILKILPYVDIFFCSEDTARLTFLKTGTAKEMMKELYGGVSDFHCGIHSANCTQPQNFGSVIYDARDTYYEEEHIGISRW